MLSPPCPLLIGCASQVTGCDWSAGGGGGGGGGGRRTLGNGRRHCVVTNLNSRWPTVISEELAFCRLLLFFGYETFFIVIINFGLP